MGKAFTNLVKKLDKNGYPVSLYYHKDEDQKKSMVGASITIMVMFIALYYLSLLSLQMMNPSYQSITQSSFTVNLADEPEFSLHNQKIRMFYVLRLPGGVPKEASAEIDKYINMTYLQMKEDWYTKQVYFEKNQTIKRCMPDDFGYDNQSHAFWHTWITDSYSFDLFCPDLENQDLTMYNQKGSMISKSIIFQVQKCVDPVDNPGFCKPDDVIKDFINEMTVQLWMIDSQIDMRYFKDESYARNQKLVSENKIRIKDEIPNELLYLGQKVYNSHESILGDKDLPTSYTFLEKDIMMKSPTVRNENNQNLLMRAQFYLSPKKLEVRRVTYGVFNALTDIGGLIKITQVGIKILINPVSEFLYFLAIISRIYLISSDDPTLNEQKQSVKNTEEAKHRSYKYLDKEHMPAGLDYRGFTDKLDRHHSSHLSRCDQFVLYLHVSIPGLHRISCWGKKKIYARLYRRGRQKVMHTLNVMNIFKQMQQILLLSNKVGKISDVTKWLNKHHKVNVIDVDEATNSEQEDASYCSEAMLDNVCDDLKREAFTGQIHTGLQSFMRKNQVTVNGSLNGHKNGGSNGGEIPTLGSEPDFLKIRRKSRGSSAPRRTGTDDAVGRSIGILGRVKTSDSNIELPNLNQSQRRNGKKNGDTEQYQKQLDTDRPFF